jgi:hypothetical protein
MEKCEDSIAISMTTKLFRFRINKAITGIILQMYVIREADSLYVCGASCIKVSKKLVHL